MVRPSPESILAWVKLNFAKLQSCPGPHQFVPVEPVEIPGGRQDRRMVCERCKAVVQPTEAAFYRMGLLHGRESRGGTDRPGDDPGLGLAGADDEHGADGDAGRPGGG